MKTLDAKMTKLGAARRKKVEARAAQLIAEEMTLSDLRRAHKQTQATVAEALDVSQDQISRIEKRSDLLLSTLRKYIEGLGGTLTLTAEFPDREPISLTGFGSIDSESQQTVGRRLSITRTKGKKAES